MHYCILIYGSEGEIAALTREQDDELVSRHIRVQQQLSAQGKLGPVARLMPTTTATTLRKAAEPLVIDGPFAETKEQLLGFYVVECANLEEAIEAASRIGTSCNSRALEIRPIAWLRQGE